MCFTLCSKREKDSSAKGRRAENRQRVNVATALAVGLIFAAALGCTVLEVYAAG
jgi:hypothetical protein